MTFIPLSLEQLLANIERHLWTTQEKYRESVEAFGRYREELTDKVLAYERKFADAVERLKNKDEPITLTKELAKKECWAEYEAKNRTEAKLEYYKALTGELVERIQTIKFLGRIKFGNMN